MTRIVQTGIAVASSDDQGIDLELRAYIEFTGSDLTRGRSGAATFKLSCWLEDDDPIWDDDIKNKEVVLPAVGIQPLTKVGVWMRTSWSLLAANEPAEKTIELFGKFRLYRGNSKIASKNTSTLDVRIHRPPAQPLRGQIWVLRLGRGASASYQVTGSHFKAGAWVTISASGSGPFPVTATAFTDGAGTFIATVASPCTSGNWVTITAYEDADPVHSTVTTMMVCP